MKNKNLIKAKAVKNDEFYTRLEDVAEEVENYLKHFKGKTVYCNCDDPAESNFTKYFFDNFHRIGLKKLISTSFKDPQYDMFSESPPAIPDFLVYDGVEKKIGKLSGSGDYRSWECSEFIEESDIVVTNPPFSLFRDFIDFLHKRKKKFLVLGNVNAASCIGILEYLKSEEMWFGVNNRGHNFIIPKSKKEYYDYSFEEEGEVLVPINTIAWYTNLDHNSRPTKWENKEEFVPENFDRYLNFDAINMDHSKDVPSNYGGLIGVPVSFLPRMNFEQFEIVCLFPTNDFLVSEGRLKKPFKRIIIRNRELSDES